MQATIHGVAKSRARLRDFTNSSETSLVAQMIQRLPTMRETRVQTLGHEDLLEKKMTTHSNTLALKIPWMEELGAGYYPWGHKESGMTERLHFHFHFHFSICWKFVVSLYFGGSSLWMGLD